MSPERVSLRIQTRWLSFVLAVWMAWTACIVSAAAHGPQAPAQRLRVVGGLAGVNQYTRHEAPFWTHELARLSGGRASAEIVPFDRAGIRAQEMLRLVQVGVVPFGTALLASSALLDPELSAPDLAGLNPDLPTLERNLAAFRPYLTKRLRERYAIELLALYVYPAQVTFCRHALTGLASLAGRRVRVSGVSQADWVGALGAIPVQVDFADIVANMRSGNIDCAITGTMSGNTIGLHEHAHHIHSMPVTWGVAAFVANGAAWAGLSADVQALLRTQLPHLEQRIWAEAARETGDGIGCNTGAASCTSGRLGSMIEVRETPADALRRRDLLVNSVLPAWVQRCGPQCAQVWAQTIGPASGYALP